MELVFKMEAAKKIIKYMGLAKVAKQISVVQ